ncbi:MAG TPA: ATP-binding protein [Longimicrobium sp.]|nr:ATP-binding protein [Longimicrobium sp.]
MDAAQTFLAPLDHSTGKALLSPRDRAAGPPSRWLAATIGRVAWWMSGKAVAELRAAAGAAPIGNRFEETLKDGDAVFEAPFQSWGSRAPAAVGSSGLMVVVGPPGSGKTRFINKLRPGLVEGNDLVVELPTDRLREQLRSRRPAAPWTVIRGRVTHVGTPHRLGALALAHAFGSRRVALVVDDVHTVGSVAALWGWLREYLDRYHGPARAVTVVMTTRERLDERALPPGAEVVRLGPLSPDEAASFFTALCDKNGVAVDQSTHPLSRAFETATLRNPLFVVICAWLARNVPEHRQNLAGLLRLRSTDILQRFVNALFDRAQRPRGLTLAGFSEVYRRVALSYWPVSRGMPEDEVDARVQAYREGGEGRLPDGFLQANGFLVREASVFDVRRVAFPHPAISDLLAAQWMVRARNFVPLQWHGPSVQLQGLAEVLAQLIDEPETLLSLARDEPSALVAVLGASPTLPERLGCRNRAWLGRLAEQAARWVGSVSPYPQPVETWEGLHRLLGEDPAVREHFRAAVEPFDPSPKGVDALAALGWPEVRRVLHGWMERRGGVELLRSRLESPEVRGFVVRTLDEAAPAVRWRAFLAACQAPDAELREAVARYLARDGGSLDERQVRQVAELGNAGLAALARGLENAPNPVKRAVSGVVIKVTGQALLVPGEYVVEDGDRKRRVAVRHPTLVPQSPEVVQGPFDDYAPALTAVSRKVGKQRVLTYYQLLVLLQCYGDPFLDVDPAGVVFHPPGQAGYEAVRDDENQLAIVTVWSPRDFRTKGMLTISKGSGTLARRSHTATPYPRVAYRIIETL